MKTDNERQVPEDEHFGASDVSRNGRHLEPEEDTCGVAQEDGRELQPQNGPSSLGKLSEEIASKIASEAETQLEAHIAVASSGPIPDPITLAAYPKEVQDKIIEWHDREVKAVYDDASSLDKYIARRDKNRALVKDVLSFAINALLIGGALIAFVITGNPNVFWSYTLLGATVIGNVVINVNKNRRNDHDDQ